VTAPEISPVSSTDATNFSDVAVRFRSRPWLIALGLIALTLAAYWPTFSNGFVNYDDPGYVVQNHFVQTGLNASSIAWAWRATIMANWHPLTWMSHMVDVRLFRLNPAGHHTSSLLLHILNVVLLFFLLLKATGYLKSAGVRFASLENSPVLLASLPLL